MTDAESPFDFQAYGQAAVAAFLEKQRFFNDLADVVGRIVEESLRQRGINVIQYRRGQKAQRVWPRRRLFHPKRTR